MPWGMVRPAVARWASSSSSSPLSSSPKKELLPGEKRLLNQFMDIPLERVRNFCIIAHVDHGKSTLADKLLELTHNIPLTTKDKQQVLDNLAVERARGITVKAQTASMVYTHPTTGEDFLLNLIDTPGHVDFSYEVARSLASCQGALLLIDTTQGVQAQTVANFTAAQDNGLQMIPVLTKIDLPTADPEPSLEQLESVLGLSSDDALWTSAKSGEGCAEVLPAIIDRLPPPVGGREKPMRALVFDSWYDEFRGVICLAQVVDGTVAPGMTLEVASTGKKYTVQEVGLVTPRRHPVSQLSAGHAGFIIAGIKATSELHVGDTLLDHSNRAEPLPGFQPAKSMVFASVFPVDTSNFEELRTAVERLCLTDASISVHKENSASLGFGLRCGFLGLLHMDVFHQRLADEYNLPVIVTAPMVPYELRLTSGEEMVAERPEDFPSLHQIEVAREPMVRASVVAPQERLSNIMSLMQEHRGRPEDVLYMEDGRVAMKYILPWQEVVSNFFDKLKSITSGYASFDYEPAGYEESDIVKVDILLNGKPVDALCFVSHRDKADSEGRRAAQKLKSVIKRQQFEVVVQAAIGNKVFAKERIPPFRKDVLTKSGKTVGGGDITRKRKLLEKQKKGKSRMKSIGDVSLSQEAFHSIMSR